MAGRTGFNVIERWQKYRQADDLGLSSSDSGDSRAVNKDGSFNVHRIGGVRNLYHLLIHMKWSVFIALVLLVYTLINILFAFVYLFIGVEHISGLDGTSFFSMFMHAFFFSAQTLTTVGYGAMAPKGILTSAVSSFEALMGLLLFSLATGLFYGRFVKPIRGVVFSNIGVVAPYLDGKAFMVRLANKFDHNLINMEANMIAVLLIEEDGVKKRRYHTLKLETSKVVMLPLNWTLVHKIDSESPLFEMSKEDCKNARLEILVMTKAFDESYSQELHFRTSWLHTEIIWNAKFKLPYTITEGKTVFDLSKLDDYEPVMLAESVS